MQACASQGIVLSVIFGGSANGRHMDSESINLGSNPSPPVGIFSRSEATVKIAVVRPTVERGSGFDPQSKTIITARHILIKRLWIK